MKAQPIDICEKTDIEITRIIQKVVETHARRGALNVLNAEANAPIREWIYAQTKFFDDYKDFDFSFVNFSTRIWMAMHQLSLDDFPRCLTCGSFIARNVVSVHQGFQYMHCSSTCAGNDLDVRSKRAKTKLERHGDKNWNNQTKIRETTLREHGVEHLFQSAQFREDAKAVKLKRYGDENWNNWEQSKQTRLERHGDENWNGSEKASQTKRAHAADDPEYWTKIQLKSKATRLERYGDENWSNQEQAVKTKTERYGVPFYNNCEQAKKTKLAQHGDENWNNVEKRQQTNLKRYGAKEWICTDDAKNQARIACIDKYGVEYWSQTDSAKLRQSLRLNAHYYSLICKDDNECEPLFSFDEYCSRKSDTELKWRCKKCKSTFEAPVNFVWARMNNEKAYARCLKCYPILHGTSKGEKELATFVKSLCDGIKIHDRTVIAPREIDILVESKKIGFEYDGLFWHSVLWNSSHNTMLSKTVECNANGIQLVRVLEDEWTKKPHQCENQVARELGINSQLAYGLDIVSIDKTTASKFIAENSYDLFSRTGSCNIALADSDQIMSILSYNSRGKDIHILALVDICGKNFNDSLEIFLAEIVKKHNPKKIIAYADLRWPSQSQILMQTGFKMMKTSKPRSWLMSIRSNSRIKRCPDPMHLKALCKAYDETKTLIENLVASGFNLIYDCGKATYVKML